MKIEIDKDGRRMYKFSHSVAKGGYLYAHKTTGDAIANQEGLRNALNAIAKKFELIDVTIRVYDTIFFVFFMSKPSLAPQKLIDSIQSNTASFAEWDNDYLWTGVYDLQETYLREYLTKAGYDYDDKKSIPTCAQKTL